MPSRSAHRFAVVVVSAGLLASRCFVACAGDDTDTPATEDSGSPVRDSYPKIDTIAFDSNERDTRVEPPVDTETEDTEPTDDAGDAGDSAPQTEAQLSDTEIGD